MLFAWCACVQGEPWPEWLVRVDRSQNIDIHMYVAGGAGNGAGGDGGGSRQAAEE